jgi:EmrB/QacA subfamily drug resistance transporter
MNTSPAIKRFIPPIVSIALFMEAVDTTIINTAIPVMSKSLHVKPIDLKVALISYLLSLAIFIPISGWLADKYGIKKVFIIALGIFTLSSVSCGFSNNLWELVIARIFQGLGGSLMMPLGRLMVVKFFERQELIQIMNRVVVLGLIGPAIGPLLGGCLTETLSWRWIFWVNIPFGILNILLAYYLLPESRAENIHKLDIIGFLLFGLGLAGLTFGLSALSEEAINLSLVILILIFSVALLIFYILHARHQIFPVLNTTLFRLRTFRISIIGNILTRLGFGGLPFLLPLMLQIPLGYSPKMAGGMVAALAIGAMLIKSISKRLLAYIGFKTLLIINTVLLGLSLSLFATVASETPIIVIIGYVLLFGILASLQYSSMNPLAFAETHPEELSGASSIHSVTIQITSSFSVAICALILKKLNTVKLGGNILNLADFHDTFLIVGFMTMISSIVFLFLKKEDGLSLVKK